jgi:hypothetical protein
MTQLHVNHTARLVGAGYLSRAIHRVQNKHQAEWPHGQHGHDIHRVREHSRQYRLTFVFEDGMYHEQP